MLARAGVAVTVLEAAGEIGGGTRSGELTLPGLVHDHCSAIHPLAVGSPAIAPLGVQWRRAPIDLAHPLDDGAVAVLRQELDATVDGLGRDGPRWRRLFGPGARGFDTLADDVLRPLRGHAPRHPVQFAHSGALAATPVAALVRTFATPGARALFAGVAAHAGMPLHRPLSSAAGVLLVCACHRHGWPVAAGGSRTIAGALAAVVLAHGGEIRVDRPVTTLPTDTDLVVLDLSPTEALRVCAGRLPARTARRYRRHRRGPGTFKLDLAVAGGIPWSSEACRHAGVVHAVGGVDELASALRDVHHGRMPSRPFVVVTQQSLADPSRAKNGVHPISAYAQVPNGFRRDATDQIMNQIIRFAPDLRTQLRALTVTSPSDLMTSNPNFLGGDILTGIPTLHELPYATGLPNTYICSAATPPGPGAHGLGGYHAAQTALSSLRKSGRSPARDAASSPHPSRW